MTSIPMFFRAAALSLVLAAPAIAQQTRTIPGLDNFSLQPSQPAPTPSATPVPAAPPLVLPTVTPTPTASPTPKPRSRATPAARTAPAAAAPPPAVTVIPEALPSPALSPSPNPAPASPAENGDSTPWLIGGAALAIALAFGSWLPFRRRERPGYEAEEFGADPAPPPRGRIMIALRPAKAGVNLLSATVECEIMLTNTGDVSAENIRLDVRMLSAHAEQDAELAAIQAQPVDRPAVPVFALAPGEERRVRSVAALPRGAIRSMTAAGRPMFVPLIAINIAYDAGSTSQAFAIGVEREDSAKLAPFWLDGPPRTFDTVAARPHAPAVER